MTAHPWRQSEQRRPDFTRHFGGPKAPSPPPPPPPPPPVDTSAADAAAAEAKRKALRRRGRSATILTSPMGADLGNLGSGPGLKTLGGGPSGG